MEQIQFRLSQASAIKAGSPLPLRYALILAVLAITSLAAHAARNNTGEITFPSKAFAKLDTFEGLNLQDADKLFNKKDYPGAYAAYKAYSFEFEKSTALPYALLRMGRCLHLLDKRNAAIKSYQDVVDYFPDDVRYAAAALFYIGQAHGQNGDTAKQTAVWARMVKDDGYVGEPNSGTALTFLGKAMAKLGKHDEAAEYQWRTAVTFLKSNPKAAEAARSAVVYHFSVVRPDHDKLKQFYVEASGFDGRGQKTNDPDKDSRYWRAVADTILRAKTSAEKKSKAAAYWVPKYGNRLADNDDVQKLFFDLQVLYEKDRKGWFASMEKQFSSKPTNIKRVLQWCNYYNRVGGDAKQKFYAKHGQPFVASMKFKEKIDLMGRLWYPLGMHDEIKAVLRTFQLQGMSDAEINQVAGFATRLEKEEDVLRYYARMKDKVFASKCRFDYYNSKSRNNKDFMEKALAEIPVLSKAPKYAAGLDMSKAKLLQGLGRYDEAITAYRTANKQPESTWGAADCMIALKDYGKAIKTVAQLEGLGGGVASQASLKIADIYKNSGNKGKEVQQLRIVMKRYPKSRESSSAHNRLESYGVALTGGESEAAE